MTLPTPPQRPELLIRAVEAGDTYVSFRWLDDPANPYVHRIRSQEIAPALTELDDALVGSDGDDNERIRRAFSGALMHPESEAALSNRLARQILPTSVCHAIKERHTPGQPVLIRLTPSTSLARVPWELLPVDGQTRLVEVADLRYEPPASVHVGRAAIPTPWNDEIAGRPTLYVVDPILPAGSGLGQTLTRTASTAHSDYTALVDHVRRQNHTSMSGVQREIGRWALSDELRTAPARFVYFGHVSSTLNEPGSASLHLSDTANRWGRAHSMNGAHRPLCSLDLLLGTEDAQLDDGEVIPASRRDRVGDDLWPMPRRVAMIACEGGADYRSAETFGLVIAMFHAGAQIITTTRWTMPSAQAFVDFAPGAEIPGPTTELAVAVDRTQQADDPVAALAQWQRYKLDCWRADPDPGPATSPLTWAGITCHECPPREVRRSHSAPILST